MPPAGFEPAIPVIHLSQTYSLDRTATGIGMGILSGICQELNRETSGVIYTDCSLGAKCE